ncbi:phage protease [Rhodococcus sp. DN22]|uniref:phage protease n=1 Tax=Rhodococcus sp. DN22 TaxID=357684 RepID=UPI0030D43B7B
MISRSPNRIFNSSLSTYSGCQTGCRRSESSPQLRHASYDKAAGWISHVYVSDDGESLLGDPEWTPSAVEAIKGGEWNYISPEFDPRDWSWEDPEEEYHFVNNVLTGAARTNIPLFKKLNPITASRIKPEKAIKASATGDGDKHNQGEPMDLKEIRGKQVADLTEEEKTFLSENKADLTAEELKTFGLDEADEEAANADAAKEAADKEAAEQVEADAKGRGRTSREGQDRTKPQRRCLDHCRPPGET